MDKKQMITKWQEIKKMENALKMERYELERKIIEEFGMKEEGSKTHKFEGYKVKIDAKVNRSLDKDKWAEIKDLIPKELSPITYKPEINNKKLKDLILHDPSIFRLACRAITTKPGKPYVIITEEDK